MCQLSLADLDCRLPLTGLLFLSCQEYVNGRDGLLSLGKATLTRLRLLFPLPKLLLPGRVG
jgi:hypothetical protein